MQHERQYPLSANPIDEAAHAAARADGSLPERESEFGSSSAPLELVEGAATGGGEGEDCEPEGEGEDSDGQRMRRHRFEIGHIVWVKTRRADCCAVRTCDCMHSMPSLWFVQTALSYPLGGRTCVQPALPLLAVSLVHSPHSPCHSVNSVIHAILCSPRSAQWWPGTVMNPDIINLPSRMPKRPKGESLLIRYFGHQSFGCVRERLLRRVVLGLAWRLHACLMLRSVRRLACLCLCGAAREDPRAGCSIIFYSCVNGIPHGML